MHHRNEKLIANALQERPTLSIIKEFLDKIVDDGKHWIWTGAANEDGYGRFWWKGHGDTYAHRISYLIFRGKLKVNDDVHHRCKVRLCVKPFHVKKIKHVDHTVKHNSGVPF